MANPEIRVLIVDDSRSLCMMVQSMLGEDPTIHSRICMKAPEAMAAALAFEPTVILQDLVMPDVEGLEMVRMFKDDPRTREIPLVVLSATDTPKVKADAFAEGANDYLVKLPDKLELLARVKYHSRGYIALMERNRAYAQIAADLEQAAVYVRAQLPEPLLAHAKPKQREPQASKAALTGISARWLFEPCSHVGGDIFGYWPLDDEHFAFYLLDTSGHGVGSCLLSVSVGDMLRRHILPDVDFHKPGQVLEALSKIYPLDPRTGKYFTIWYGVYHAPTRTLTYSGAGHPPALIIRAASHRVDELPSSGPFIGMDEIPYDDATATLKPGDRLYLFSDGVYEIRDHQSGRMWSFEDLKRHLSAANPSGHGEIMARLLEAARSSQGSATLDDDFAIVEFEF